MNRNNVELSKAKGRTKKIIIGFVFLLALTTYQTVDGQDLGEAAPDFTVNLAGGGTFTLSDQADKVVMIFFFGNDCPYCFSSGPLVQDLYEDYMSNSDFVAIGLDTWNSSSDEESVTNFATSTGITFPLALNSNSVKVDYGWTYDRIVVIDKEGIIRRKANAPAGNDIIGSAEAIQASLDGVVAVEDFTKNISTTLYPIPARDILHVDIYLEDDSELEMHISDITGKERKKVSYLLGSGQQNLSFNTEDLEQGMYLYTIQVNDKVESGKFLIQK